MIRPAKAARRASVLLVFLALAAVPALSGCGGGGEDSSTATTTGTSSETAESNRNSSNQGKGEGGQGSEGKDGKSSGGSQGSKASQPEGEEAPKITPEQEREVTKADIILGSTFPAGGTLPAKHTCDGADTWPALRWKGLPPEAEELVLLVLSVRPADQKLVFNWAVAGLDPSLTEIEEGKLPPGAIVGENSFGKDGYSICPEAGTAENYIFMLFAIPEALDPEPGFDARTVREEVLAQHGNVGLLSASYARK